MARRGVIRKAGGEVVSRRLLAARLIGRVSGLTIDLAEAEQSLHRALERCDFAEGDGAPLLDKQALRLIADIKKRASTSAGVIREARAIAYKADEAARKTD